MTTWVLLAIIISNGTEVLTQEFSNKEKCAAALASFLALDDTINLTLRATCAEK